jgi:hypothetical protein
VDGLGAAHAEGRRPHAERVRRDRPRDGLSRESQLALELYPLGVYTPADGESRDGPDTEGPGQHLRT